MVDFNALLAKRKERKQSVLLNFDARTVAPATGGGISFPLNDYPVEIVAVSGQPVAGSTDKGMLVLTLKTLAAVGEIPAGTEHLYRFNLWHDNEQTVKISFAQLSSVCHVIGRMQIGDSDQLLGGRMIATIGPQKDNPKYSEIKVVKDLQGNPPGQQGAPAPAQPIHAVPAYATPAQPSQPAPGPQAGWGPSPNAAPVQQTFQQQPAVPPQGFGQAAATSAPWQNGAATGAAPAANKPPWG